MIHELPQDIIGLFGTATPYVGYSVTAFSFPAALLLIAMVAAACQGTANGKGFFCAKVLALLADLLLAVGVIIFFLVAAGTYNACAGAAAVDDVAVFIKKG